MPRLVLSSCRVQIGLEFTICCLNLPRCWHYSPMPPGMVKVILLKGELTIQVLVILISTFSNVSGNYYIIYATIIA